MSDEYKVDVNGVIKLLKDCAMTIDKLSNNQKAMALIMKRQGQKIDELETQMREFEQYVAGYNACGYHD